jgi:hypothetical protein
MYASRNFCLGIFWALHSRWPQQRRTRSTGPADSRFPARLHEPAQRMGGTCCSRRARRDA